MDSWIFHPGSCLWIVLDVLCRFQHFPPHDACWSQKPLFEPSRMTLVAVFGSVTRRMSLVSSLSIISMRIWFWGSYLDSPVPRRSPDMPHPSTFNCRLQS